MSRVLLRRVPVLPDDPYPPDLEELPEDITDRGRDVWKGRNVPNAREKPGAFNNR